MEISIKGRVVNTPDKYNIYGKIHCKDFNEVYKFTQIDIINKYRNNISIGDIVGFTIKSSKNGNFSATDVEVIQSKKELTNNSKKRLSSIDISNSDSRVITEFKTQNTDNFLSLEYQNDDIIDLIKIIVQDDKITEIEARFLEEKLVELNLDKQILDDITNHLKSNNPYLDKIFNLIFRDGEVNELELKFIKEKQIENKYSLGAVNDRFWRFAINYHLNVLLEKKYFIDVIKLWHILKITDTLNDSNFSVIQKLNINLSNNFETILEKAHEDLLNEIKAELSKKYNFNDDEFNAFYREINLTDAVDDSVKNDESKQPETGKTEKNKTSLIINNVYTLKEIFSILDVDKKIRSQIINSSKSYYLYDNDNYDNKHILFLNKLNSKVQEANRLKWFGSSLSQPQHKSIINLYTSSPLLFIKKEEKEFKYLGVANSININNSSPVEIIWELVHNNETENPKTNPVDEDENSDEIDEKATYLEDIFNDETFIIEMRQIVDNPFISYDKFRYYLEHTMSINSKDNRLVTELWANFLNKIKKQ